jgi:hypothetical protein
MLSASVKPMNSYDIYLLTATGLDSVDMAMCSSMHANTPQLSCFHSSIELRPTDADPILLGTGSHS